MNFGTENLPFKPIEGTDMSPYDEKVIVSVERNTPKGYVAHCRLRINHRWDTDTDWLEIKRLFGHKEDLSKEQCREQIQMAIDDLKDKLDWVYQANHGLLDTEEVIIRFKR